MPAPADPLLAPDALLGLLGDFWYGLYDGRDLLRHVLGVRGEQMEHTLDHLQEALALESQKGSPLLHRPRWRYLLLRQSQRRQVPYLFDDADLFWDGTPNPEGGQIRFGDERPGSGWAFPLPQGLLELDTLSDRIQGGRQLWTREVDYRLQDLEGVRHIIFRVDPFTQPDFARALVLGDAKEEASEVLLTLWLYGSGWDVRYLQRHWGSLVEYQEPSTPGYQERLDLLYATRRGTAGEHLLQLLEASTGIPRARVSRDGVPREGPEILQEVVKEEGRTLLVSDQGAYSLAPANHFSLHVGDTLTPGEFLGDGISLLESFPAASLWRQTGQGPPQEELPSWLGGLGLDASLAAIPLRSVLFFGRQETDWIWQLEEGRWRGSFALGGFPEDQELFWDTIHARGLASGTTLAEHLDLRPGEGREGALTVESLPSRVCPLAFLLGQLLHDAWVVRIRADAISQRGRPGDSRGRSLVLPERLLREMVPPWMLFILLLEAPQVASRNPVPEVQLESADPLSWVEQSPPGSSRVALRGLPGC